MKHKATNTGVVAATVAVLLTCVLSACGGPSSRGTTGKEPPPAAVAVIAKEAELATVALTEAAERRLGVETVTATERQVPLVRQVGGELTVAPGRTMMLTAPVGGTVAAADRAIPSPGSAVSKGQVLLRLVPLVPVSRDVAVSYEAEAAAAKARDETARQQLQRAEQLLKDKAGSQRSLEQAQQEARQAEAAYQAAAARLERLRQRPLEADVSVDLSAPDAGVLRQVLVTPGLQVAAGAPLVEVVNVRTLWIRVPVYAGDAAMVDPAQAVQVTPLGSGFGRESRTARRVAGPPSADPQAASVDLFFVLDNSDGVFRPGERVNIALPLKASEHAVVVPASAVVYDANGGTWVYARTAPHVYQRRRIQLLRTSGDLALVGRGVQANDDIVTVAVAEIFGAEFGNGK